MAGSGERSPRLCIAKALVSDKLGNLHADYFGPGVFNFFPVGRERCDTGCSHSLDCRKSLHGMPLNRARDEPGSIQLFDERLEVLDCSAPRARGTETMIHGAASNLKCNTLLV